VERKIKQVLNVLENVMKNMKDHIIICGVCDETVALIDYLKSEGIDLVILASKEDMRDGIIKMGVYIMEGDPSEEELLKRAKIDQARAIIAASTNDAQDALIILTAKQLRKDIKAVALATSAENKKKLHQVGADVVISPRIIGGRLLAKAAARRKVNLERSLEYYPLFHRLMDVFWDEETGLLQEVIDFGVDRGEFCVPDSYHWSRQFAMVLLGLDHQLFLAAVDNVIDPDAWNMVVDTLIKGLRCGN
jgi:hypothetical protein